MKIFRVYFPAAVYAGLMFFGGCAYLSPFIENLNIISVDQERALGAKLSKDIERQLAVEKTDSLARVQRIGQKLVAVLPRKDFDYRFSVVQDKTLNAFTLPGGAVYVHTGLLAAVNDNELAGVLGHELGHAYERHPTQSLTRAYGLHYLADMLIKGNASKRKAFAFQIAKQGILTKYSRADELEADAVGLTLVKKAAFAPEGLISFLRKIERLEAQSPGLAFLRSHPPTPERIRRLEEALRA